MMVASSWEMMLLMFVFGAGSDLLSIIDSNDYFKSRQIPVTVGKMVELATAQPVDGKSQVAQLLALRQLADDAAKVKKANNFKDILAKIEEVAKGQKAQDLQGFAAEYAKKTAAALGSDIKPPPFAIPANSVRQDALNWFPKDAKLVVSFDFRHDSPKYREDLKALRKKIYQFLNPAAKNQIYSVIEEFGNVRASRWSMAYSPSQIPGQGKIYMRLSGKADHRRLVSWFKKNLPPNTTIKEVRSFRGKRITIISANNNPPGVALVGDEDLIIAGHERNGANSIAVVQEMLDIRRGKQPSVLTGPMADKIKKVSAKAVGLFVGELPEELRRELLNGPAPGFRTLPKHMRVELHRKGDDLKFAFHGQMKNANDAKMLVQDVNNLVQLGVTALQNPPPQPPGFPIPNKLYKQAQDMLKSIKVKANGNRLDGSMTVKHELISTYTSLSAMLFSQFRGAAIQPPPPPVKKKEIKEKKKQSLLIRPGMGTQPRNSARVAPLTLSREMVACLDEYTSETVTPLSA